MTTLTAHDIVTVDQGNRPQATAATGGLEFFSRPAVSSDGNQWMTWLRQVRANPSSVEDDVVTAPSSMVLEQAMRLLSQLIDVDAPPDVVTLGPNGEVVFERRAEDIAEQIVLYDDLRVDFIVYRDGRLESRTVISQPEVAFAW